MKFTLKGVLIGKGSRVSSRGNAYSIVSISDGFDNIQLMVRADSGIDINNYELYKPCTAVVDYFHNSKFSSFSLVSLNMDK